MSTTKNYWMTPSYMKVIYDDAPQNSGFLWGVEADWKWASELCNENILCLKWGDGYMGVYIDQNIKLYM